MERNDFFAEPNANQIQQIVTVASRPVSAVGARGGILGGGEVVGVEGAVPLEAPPEPVDVVRVAEARHEVRLRALQEADLIWKCGEEERRIHAIDDRLCRMIAFSEKEHE